MAIKQLELVQEKGSFDTVPPASKQDVLDTLGTSRPARPAAAAGIASARIANAGFPFLEPARSADELGWLGIYRVIKLLGQGGMGMVFLAEDQRLCRSVALKVMHPELAKDESVCSRFLREARATATIRSEHIVAIHEIGDANGLPYIVTELLQGQPLNDWMKEHDTPSVAKVLDLGVQLAGGLEASHKAGVIHRDIKPSNTWVEEPSGRIKILDFGLARTDKHGPELTRVGEILGTPAYMAPEQAEGLPVDERCDLFSLGCVLYQLATGVLPFNGPSTVAVLCAIVMDNPPPPAKRRPELPAAFSELVMQLLAKDPKARPASASVVVEALLTATSSTIVSPASSPQPNPDRSPAPSGDRVPRRGASSRRRWMAAGLAGLLGLAAAAGLFMYGPSLPYHADGSAQSTAHHEGAAKPPGAGTTPAAGEDILVGMSAPFSGPARELGRAVELGVLTYFARVNDQGGIAGRKLKLVPLDDGYQPDRALANMKELIEERRVLAVLGNVGTATAELTLPYALSKKVVFFGATSGAPFLRREPPDRYVFNFRASCAEETAAVVNYLTQIKGLSAEQIAVFAQQDSYGDAGFEGVAKTLRKSGRKPEQIVRVGHERTSIHVSEAVKEILRHGEIRAVVMVSTYRPAAQFIRELKDAKPDMVFANISFVGSDALAEELLEMGPNYAPGVIVTQVVPHPASQASIVIQFRESLNKYYPNERACFGSLEGYIDAAIFAEGLRRAGVDPTSEKLVDALESIRDHDLGLGTPLHYGPSEHQASRKVWGTIINAEGRYSILELE